MKLQPFDIIAYKGNGIISKMIEYSTSSEYSHVALVLDDWHIIETNFFKPVGVKHFSYRMGVFDIYRLKEPLTSEEVKAAIKYIQKTLNSKYDLLEALSYCLYRLFGTVIDVNNKYICSSWLNNFFAAGDRLLVDTVNGIVTPNAIISSQLVYKAN